MQAVVKTIKPATGTTDIGKQWVAIDITFDNDEVGRFFDKPVCAVGDTIECNKEPNAKNPKYWRYSNLRVIPKDSNKPVVDAVEKELEAEGKSKLVHPPAVISKKPNGKRYPLHRMSIEQLEVLYDQLVDDPDTEGWLLGQICNIIVWRQVMQK